MAGLIVAFGAALALGWVAVRVGPTVGLVDTPDGSSLKVHRRPAVLLGGPVLYLAFHIGSWLEETLDWGLVLATGILLVVGIADDRVGLGPLTRLGAEVLAGVTLWWFAELPPGLGGVLGFVGVVGLTVVAVNAVNLFDGLDGLAGTAALATCIGMAVMASIRGIDTLPAMILGASLLGFLWWNRPPARMFLGDGGAYVLGGLLSYLVVRASIGEMSALVATLTLGVFLGDLAVTLIRRRLAGAALFAGDRSHVYDQLADRGWPLGRIVLASLVAQALFAGAALALQPLTRSFWALAGIAGVGLVWLAVAAAGGFLKPSQR